MRIPKLFKETSLFAESNTITGKVDELTQDIEDAKTTATNYITETADGIMVHPEGDMTTGWSIKDALELLKEGLSYFKVWLDSSVAKVRVGLETVGHVVFSPDGMEVFSDSTTSVAEFGDEARIGREDESHVMMDGSSLEMANSSGMRYFTLREDPEVTTTVMATVYGNTLPSNAVQGSTFYVTYVHGYNDRYTDRASFTQGVSESQYENTFGGPLTITYESDSGEVSTTITNPTPDYQIRVVSIEYLVEGSLVYAAFGSASNLASRGNYTFSSGEGLITDSDKQTAIGKFNDNQSTNAFEIGNGTSDSNRSNAFAVDWSGNALIDGDVQDMSGALRYAPIAYGSLTGMASALTLTTSAQKLPLGGSFVGSGCSASSNGIVVEEAGTYMITGSAYLFGGYTANDIVHLLVHVGATEVVDCLFRATTTNPYQTISTAPVVVQLAANTVVTLHAYNQVAARGTINSRAGHGLTVLRIA